MGMIRTFRHRAAFSVARQFNWKIHRNASTWARHVSQESNNVQIYISNNHDPYLNLSIEHFLLENSPKKSVILFLYVNRPCVVIGRNQNPWLEVNLNALNGKENNVAVEGGGPGLGKVELVRRRSGGGTVFHDHGNVNWTAISPSEGFTRDKHAEMIVGALRHQGVERARVNKRHDIVLDQGLERSEVPSNDFHRTPWTTDDLEHPETVKVSGSAYKLTRGRALHHGTCLLSSPNLQTIHQYLRAPGKPFIHAKGVESVSSPVSNVGLSTEAFNDAVIKEFAKMYLGDGAKATPITIPDEAFQDVEVNKGCDELKTLEWMFDQTPQFTFETHPEIADLSLDTHVLSAVPPSLRVSLSIRHGQITEGSLSFSADPSTAEQEAEKFHAAMTGRKLRDNWSWHDAIDFIGRSPQDANVTSEVVKWLEQMLPINVGKLCRPT